jgi:hypothetical protein
LNGGKYLSNVDFNIKANVKEVYEVIDISRKTCKFSQEQLQKMKKERLTRKHSPAISSKQSFSDWYNNADMPHKIDGRWVDLETGFTYD